MNWSKVGKWLVAMFSALLLVACGNGGEVPEEGSTADPGTETTDTAQSAGDNEATEETTEEETASESDFDTSQTVNVISREDGSGTRDAFTEITGVLVEEGDTEEDQTYQGATIQNSTNGVMQAVGEDPAAIGYISLGSVDDTVKAINVDGVEATAENVASGEYSLARPFNVAYSGELSEAAQDFWDFIFSEEGQAVVEEEGYIESPDATGEPFEANENASGSISVVGSTSVTPVMEALAEAYPGEVQVDITSNGSSAGMTAAIDGSADIGMASRELDEEEQGALESQALAMDGIAVIVNNENPTEDLTLEEIRQIFVGEITTWDEVAS
jgi:phosphate transport system substrate-binding protein